MTSMRSGTGAWTAATPSTGTPTQMFWRWGNLTRCLHEMYGRPANTYIAATVGTLQYCLMGCLLLFGSPTACS